MKRFITKGILFMVLAMLVALPGCKRKMSPEEFAKNLHTQYTLKAHSNPVLTVAYSPDGKLLVSTDSDGKIVFWDPATGTEKSTANFHNIPLYAMAFSRDGKVIAAGGKEQAIIFYDAEKMQPVNSFIAHNDQVLGIAWGPNQIFASASCAQRDPRQWCIKGEVGVWKLEKINQAPVEIKRFPDHTDWINCIAFSANGKYLATGGGDNVINVYDTKSWELVKTLQGHTGRISVLAFAPRSSDELASASLDGSVRVWDIPGGKQRKLMKSEGSKFMAMAWSPDGKMIATGGEDQKITIFLVKKEKVLKELAGLESALSALSFSPDGTAIAGGLYDNNILVLKAERTK